MLLINDASHLAPRGLSLACSRFREARITIDMDISSEEHVSMRNFSVFSLCIISIGCNRSLSKEEAHKLLTSHAESIAGVVSCEFAYDKTEIKNKITHLPDIGMRNIKSQALFSEKCEKSLVSLGLLKSAQRPPHADYPGDNHVFLEFEPKFGKHICRNNLFCDLSFACGDPTFHIESIVTEDKKATIRYEIKYELNTHVKDSNERGCIKKPAQMKFNKEIEAMRSDDGKWFLKLLRFSSKNVRVCAHVSANFDGREISTGILRASPARESEHSSDFFRERQDGG